MDPFQTTGNNLLEGFSSEHEYSSPHRDVFNRQTHQTKIINECKYVQELWRLYKKWIHKKLMKGLKFGDVDTNHYKVVADVNMNKWKDERMNEWMNE